MVLNSMDMIHSMSRSCEEIECVGRVDKVCLMAKVPQKVTCPPG